MTRLMYLLGNHELLFNSTGMVSSLKSAFIRNKLCSLASYVTISATVVGET